MKNIFYDLTEGATLGTLLSTGMASIWPEAIHSAAVVATAIAGAIAVFFTNRFLRKKFPESK